VRGSSSRVPAVEMAKGRVIWGEGSRQGAVPVRLLGDAVRVIA